jgi:hypothetical protein
MTETAHHATAPEDRIPFLKKVAYGSGAFVNNLLASAIGGMMIVLNLGLGMNPALVGLLSALPRLTDAITDPAHGLHLGQHAVALGAAAAVPLRRRDRGRCHLRGPVAAAGERERVLLLLVLPGRLADLLSRLYHLRDPVGRHGLRADAGLPRADAAHGGAELHRSARLHDRALVPRHHAVGGPLRRHGRGGGGARDRGRRRRHGRRDPARGVPPGALRRGAPVRRRGGEREGEEARRARRDSCGSCGSSWVGSPPRSSSSRS